MAKAARWRDEKRNAQRFVLGQTKSQTVETARAQSRKAGLPAWRRGYAASSDKAKPFEAQADEKVSEPPGSRKLILAIDFGSRRNRRRRERRAITNPTFSARKSLSEPGSRRRAAKCPSGPTSRREWGRPQGRPHFSFWPPYSCCRVSRPRVANRRQRVLPSPPPNLSPHGSNRSGSWLTVPSFRTSRAFGGVKRPCAGFAPAQAGVSPAATWTGHPP